MTRIQLQGDQVIRAIAAVCLFGIFVAHKGLNGSGPVDVPGVGMVAPLVLVVLAELMLAFPELLDRLPFGPTRSLPEKQQKD